ncbi:asparagine synthase (glutamine-hydrolyzing) [Kitasatospora sp. NPDC097605]|uniref:asparagine synthase (glutamine-hydrolyzing) n=1 Tax=Kitasatospora sp. NPDC097605 TaxID=3157226 RepID=UPI00332C4371
MCGIAGVFLLGDRPARPEDHGIVARMSERQHSRGPDGTALLRRPTYSLAFNRLAVFAEESGAQPFVAEGFSHVTVVNGEIYNFRELRKRWASPATDGSDCSVVHDLLPVLGPALFGALRGMFAVVGVDERERKLTLARDHFGIKPLFYAVRDGRLYVASELKALFTPGAVPCAPDWAFALQDAHFSLVSHYSADQARTYFDGVREVPPGSTVNIDLDTGSVTTRRFWQPGFQDSGELNEDPAPYVERYQSLLDQAVSRACMADQPPVVQLSGGIDSVAVAALAARHRDIRLWTVLSPTSVETGDFRAAARAADHLGLPLHWVDASETERDLSVDDWQQILWQTETPLADPGFLYRLLMSRAIAENSHPTKAVLSGQGSDEFNGGYTTALAPPGRRNWQGFVDSLDERRRRTLLNAAPGAVSEISRGVTEGCLRTSWLAELVESPSTDLYRGYIDRKLYDLRLYNCLCDDRTSAAHGLESRPVFLDVDLVDFSLAVPPALRGRLFDDKAILRRAVRGFVPDDLADRPKVPFYAGAARSTGLAALANLLERGQNSFVELATSGTIAAGVLDPDALRRAIREAVRHPQRDGVQRLLRLLSLGALEVVLTGQGEPHPGFGASAPVGTAGPGGSAPETAAGRVDAARVAVPAGVSFALEADIRLMREHGAERSGKVYLLRRGRLEYSLDPAVDANLADLVPRLVEPATVEQLARRAGRPVEEVRTGVADLLQYRVLRTLPAETTGGPVG